MYRRRAYSRSYSRVKKAKYSNETNTMGVGLESGSDEGAASRISAYEARELAMLLIPASKNQGMRKAKNFDLSIQTSGMNVPVHFALVYVPEGQKPGKMNFPAPYSIPDDNVPAAPASLYEPNQNVIISGVLPTDTTNPIHFRTRLARNLNSGDAIYLCIEPSFASEAHTYGLLEAQLNYAICY